jgi:Flp pilus assembly protein TadG
MAATSGLTRVEAYMRTTLLKSRSTRAAKRRGATVVEMAFAAPLLFLIVFIIFEFGHALMMHHLMLDVAREGCRIAALPQSTNADVLSQVDDMLVERGVFGADAAILVNSGSGDVSSASTGDLVQIRIELAAANFLPLPRHFSTGSLVVHCDRRKE